jgi:hypothetical protein
MYGMNASSDGAESINRYACSSRASIRSSNESANASGNIGRRNAPLSRSAWWLTRRCCRIVVNLMGNSAIRDECRSRISNPKVMCSINCPRGV